MHSGKLLNAVKGNFKLFLVYLEIYDMAIEYIMIGYSFGREICVGSDEVSYCIIGFRW